MTAHKPKFPVGTRFTRRHNVCTVVDVYTTRNLAGEFIRDRYVATHLFLGRPLQEFDIPENSVAMGLIVGETSRD